jgi:hypothetical protein
LLLTSEATLVRRFPKFCVCETVLELPFRNDCNKEELPLVLPKGMPNGAYAPCAEVNDPPEKVAVWKYACEKPEPTFTGLLKPN